MRYVSIDLSPDNYLQQLHIFGGFAGEHNETVLQTRLPKRMIGAEYYSYHFDFQTSEGSKITSPSILASELDGDIICFSLTEQLTVAGKLLFNIVGQRFDGDIASLTSKTNMVTLYIGESPDGNDILPDPNGYKDILLEMIDERVTKALEGIQSGEGGTIVVDQTFKPDSIHPQSGKAVEEAIKNNIKDKANKSDVPKLFVGTEISGGKNGMTLMFTESGGVYLKYKVGDLYFNTKEQRCYQCVDVEFTEDMIAGNPHNELTHSWIGLNYQPDTSYNPESFEAQSGLAVAKAIAGKQDKFADVTEDENEVIVEVNKLRKTIKNSKGSLLLKASKIYLESQFPIDVGSSKLENVAEPESDNDAATKGYVDSTTRADQTYNPESKNAQSGKAVAEAIQPKLEIWQPNKNYKVGDIVLRKHLDFANDGESLFINYVDICKQNHTSVQAPSYPSTDDNDAFWNSYHNLLLEKAYCAKSDFNGNVIDETYATKREVNHLISAGLTRQIVSSMTDIIPLETNVNIIYMIPNTSTDAKNIYDEYISTLGEDGEYYFEKIGSTEVDLANYVTKTEFDTEVGNIQTALDRIIALQESIIGGE